MKILKKAIIVMMVICMSVTMFPVSDGYGTQTVQAASKVKLNKAKATLVPGQKLKLKISGTKTKAKWSSSKKSVATVDSKGQITAKKKGNCYIVAKIGKKQYKCKVTVVNLSAFTLNKKSLSLEENDGYQLKIKYKPSNVKISSKDVKWSSSDDDIAGVDEEGYVYGYTEGTATITAKIGNKKTKCKVTVKPAVIDVDSIDISDSTLEMTVGEEKQLYVTIHPDNATEQNIIWSSSNDKIVSVDKNGLVKAVSEGTADITATVDGIAAKCKVTVKPIYITDFTVDEKIEIRMGNKKSIIITLVPINATEIFKPCYESEDTTIAVVSQTGKITPVSVGETVIKVRFKDIEKKIIVSILKSKQQLLSEEDTRYKTEVSDINKTYDDQIAGYDEGIELAIETYGYYYGTYEEYRKELTTLTENIATLQKQLIANPNNTKFKKQLNALIDQKDTLQNEWKGKTEVEMYNELKEDSEEERTQKLEEAKTKHLKNIEDINALEE